METPTAPQANILVVDDVPNNLALIANILHERGYKVRLATSGKFALQTSQKALPDLVLLDLNMPEMDGFETCRRFKANAAMRSIPIIFLTAQNDVESTVQAFTVGAADYVVKPFRKEELLARVDTHLRIKQLQQQLHEHLANQAKTIEGQVKEIRDLHTAVIHTFLVMAEGRDSDTGLHLNSIQDFSILMAEKLRERPEFESQIDDNFIRVFSQSCMLHDIGKVSVSDRVLLKKASLTPEEYDEIKSHAALGVDFLRKMLVKCPGNAFLHMGIDIAYSHHEKWDGSGYPQGLVGEAIPLPARIVHVIDVYDALRRRRPYKLPFSHEQACKIISEGDARVSPSEFDPRILACFLENADLFAKLFERIESEAEVATVHL